MNAQVIPIPDRSESPRPEPARLGSSDARRQPRDMRIDLRLIADMVEPNSRVLDVGCGDGTLLDFLTREKKVDGRGIELGMDGVHQCVAQGLSVIQGDAEADLKDYPTAVFDYAILSDTLQAMRDPRAVLLHLARIGRRAIVSFPNFGYWRIRLQLMVRGRMPVTEHLRYNWWDTPNIHLCTINDFLTLCQDAGLTVERSLILDRAGRVTGMKHGSFANLLGEQAVFMLRRNGVS